MTKLINQLQATGLKNKVQLITYPNRMGENLKELRQIMDYYLSGAIGGVHILPIYPSNADGGFAPLTHKEVDPAYGTWEDVENIANQFDLCLDLTLNHISDQSEQFLDFIQYGKRSRYADLFTDVSSLGPITPEDLAKIHIRKEKEPFRDVTFADGSKTQVWCTFTEKQIDLNYKSPQTFALVEDYMQYLMDRGVRLFRFDAFGYVTTRIGTPCFLVEPEIYDILHHFREIAEARGAHLLPEVHDHYSYQVAIAQRGMYAYGFALPVLLLHAFVRKTGQYLQNWLRICPHNQITVLDTHDGICIPDVEGLIPDDEIQYVVDDVSNRSGDPVMRGSAAHVGSVGAIYQLTCTYFDALRRDERQYLAARAVQFFTPGIPQVYYQGLLAGTNDHALVEKTGEKRDINRSYYSLKDVEVRMDYPLVRRLVKLMQFRSFYPAFDGRFDLQYADTHEVRMGWRKGEFKAYLHVDFRDSSFSVRYFDVIEQRERDLNLSEHATPTPVVPPHPLTNPE
ncbi:MAG: sucrose phosphorylase [Polyangiales bacterium]